jgi:hypothetical protein
MTAIKVSHANSGKEILESFIKIYDNTPRDIIKYQVQYLNIYNVQSIIDIYLRNIKNI